MWMCRPRRRLLPPIRTCPQQGVIGSAAWPAWHAHHSVRARCTTGLPVRGIASTRMQTQHSLRRQCASAKGDQHGATHTVRSLHARPYIGVSNSVRTRCTTRHPEYTNLEGVLSAHVTGPPRCGHAAARADIRITDRSPRACPPSIHDSDPLPTRCPASITHRTHQVADHAGQTFAPCHSAAGNPP